MKTETHVQLDHARDRMHQRGISASEVEEALSNGEPAPSQMLEGMVRIVGTTSAGRRLSIVRLEHFPVIVSVVELDEPQ